ncbi:macrophage mannose receptor 1-like [Pseudophryne corroboree]|uniref:macrophage mannose receptor 1-like n=1 Tax=Pseudophryne corroboree TaxID=495146 RepID=UPI003081F3D2
MTASIILILLYFIRPSLQLDSDTFLIYSEEHQKCIEGQNSILSVATCNEKSNTQKFRWISEHQLINVESTLCLAATAKKDMALVTLYQCDGASEFQKWECQNDTMFGIQGENLHLDYGDKKVILYNGSGYWSRWIIFGTSDDLCVKTYEELYTLKGNSNGQPCVFPFKYNSQWYVDCTLAGSPIRRLWCSTTADFDKDKLFGFCPSKGIANNWMTDWWTTDSVTGANYQIMADSAITWYQARRSCQQQDAELLSITELHEQTYISGFTNGLTTALWVGLNSLDYNAGWRWDDGSPFRYLNWAPGNPSIEPEKNCVALNPGKNVKWESRKCGQKLGYICKKGNSTLSSILPSGTNDPISCPPLWIPYSGYCYSLHKEARIWKDAMLACRKEEGDLASLHNIGEASFVTSQFEYENIEYVWLGLNDLKVQLFFEWSDGSPVTYTVWQRTEPSHLNNEQEDCVALYTKDGLWADQMCENKFPYMCKRKPLAIAHDQVPVDEGCDKGWRRHGYYCYSISESSTTFSEANSTCNNKAAFLMTVDDRFEQTYLTSVIGIRPEKYFWTGLSNIEEKETFQWTNSERVLYTHWNADMPGRKQGCVVMRTGNKGGLWDVVNCDEKAKYVCKKLALGVTPPPAPTTMAEPTCPEGWTTSNTLSACYKHYYTEEADKKKSWYEARDFCRAIGGDLLSISSEEEKRIVRTMLMRPVIFSQAYWVGLVSSDPDEGFTWSDGTPMGYQNWGYGEPNNYQGVEFCGEVKVYFDLPWNDKNCEVPANWICELKKGVKLKAEPTEPTIPEYQHTSDGWIIQDDTQYYVSKEELTMDKAREFCKRNFGDLTTISSLTERKFLWKYALKYRESFAFFIGLKLALDKEFKWMDNSPMDFVEWAIDEPNFLNNDENCVVMYRDLGFWNDINCGYPNAFICERKTSSINVTFAPTAPAPEGGCPADWLSFGKQCYRIFGKEEDEVVGWTQARAACQSLKGNLASIHDNLVQAFLVGHLKDFNVDVWIGLNDINVENKFLWTDQSGVLFTNWAKGQPFKRFRFRKFPEGHPIRDSIFVRESDYVDTDCVAMKCGPVLDAGSWIVEECKLNKGYICQKSKDPTLQPVPTTVPPSNIYQHGDSSYTIVKTKMKWDEARRWCKDSGSELISILDEYTTSFLKVHLNKDKEPFWIGLNSNMTDSQFRWIDNWKLRYTKWAAGEPKNQSACVYMDEDSEWKTSACDENYASICKESKVVAPTEPPQKPGKCPESTSEAWIPFRGHCYLFESSSTRYWAEASVECLKLGGNLLSIEDSVESDFIHHHLEALQDKVTTFWLGLYKNLEEKWLWLDNTPLDFVNWKTGEPSEQEEELCVEVHATEGTWNNIYCLSYRGYVCKKLKTPIPTEKPVAKPEEKKADAPSRGMTGGVVILVILVIAGTTIAVYYLYRRKLNKPPTDSSFDNTLYFNSSRVPPTQDTNVLVEHIEQNERAIS